MKETKTTGYVRPRGSKLQAVIVTPDGRKARRALGLEVGQEAEAEAILEQALAKLRTEEATEGFPAGALTVEAWGEKWIEDRKARGKLEWHEESHLKYFVFPKLGSRTLAAVNDVTMLDWARGLEKTAGPSGKTPSGIWEDTDLPELEANARVMGAGFEIADVQALLYDPCIPEDRRVLYALEFLTGMRTGEAAARTWADWEPEYCGDLGRLVCASAYNTRHRLLKTTKTKVEKWIPVHPALAELLDAWKREGWERYRGRAPTAEDLIVPASGGKPRNNSYSWRCFALDLERLEIPPPASL